MLTRILSICFFLFFLMPPHGTLFGSEDIAPLLEKAANALKRADRKSADYYAARWLGLCENKNIPDCRQEDFEAFLKKRKLEPKGFISEEWGSEFLDWFEKSVRVRWGVESARVREKERSFEIAQSTYEGKYFVTIVAYPELELWHTLKQGILSRRLVLPMASFRDRPTVFFGKLMKAAPLQSRPFFLDMQKRSLHYFWTPQFFDVDGDGEPEIWLRYNLSWGNGFTQVLDVYRIREGKDLRLLHRFQGIDGFARRLEDGQVQVGEAIKPIGTTQKLQTWRFENKEFKKVAEKEAPFTVL